MRITSTAKTASLNRSELSDVAELTEIHFKLHSIQTLKAVFNPSSITFHSLNICDLEVCYVWGAYLGCLLSENLISYFIFTVDYLGN